MTTTPSISLPELQRLQQVVNDLVHQVGLPQAVQLLEGLCDQTTFSVNAMEKTRCIYGFIMARSIQVFDLEEPKFLTSEVAEYRQARMACYHLIKRYANISYTRIGELFGRNKRSVMYFHQKAEELLSVPKFYRGFTERHGILEKATLTFMAKLAEHSA